MAIASFWARLLVGKSVEGSLVEILEFLRVDPAGIRLATQRRYSRLSRKPSRHNGRIDAGPCDRVRKTGRIAGEQHQRRTQPALRIEHATHRDRTAGVPDDLPAEPMAAMRLASSIEPTMAGTNSAHCTGQPASRLRSIASTRAPPCPAVAAAMAPAGPNPTTKTSMSNAAAVMAHTLASCAALHGRRA